MIRCGCFLMKNYKLLLQHNCLTFQSNTTMAATGVDVTEEKSKLRSLIKIKLKKLTTTDKIRQTYCVTYKLINHPDFLQAKRVAIYVNMKNEIGTYDVIKEAFLNCKEVYIPQVIGSDMKMVKLDSFEDLESMPKTKWGIIQPLETDNREDCFQTGGVELVVVPGVAFTTSGLRLGHGRGYYDRFLAKNKEVTRSKFKAIGVCFNEQVLQDLPVTDRDFPLSWVASPETSGCVKMPTEMPSPPPPFII